MFSQEEKELLIANNLDPTNISYSQVYDILHSSVSATIPTIANGNQTAKIEHEASSSQISQETMFYLQSRGMTESDATGLIINGFCKEIFTQLPMEFLIEAQKLIDIEMQDSIG